tara:strand:+ start:1022 stop:1138 length:117 start_codon:yes stop_codon:yes gene_type:complete
MKDVISDALDYRERSIAGGAPGLGDSQEAPKACARYAL